MALRSGDWRSWFIVGAKNSNLRLQQHCKTLLPAQVDKAKTFIAPHKPSTRLIMVNPPTVAIAFNNLGCAPMAPVLAD